jgi:hypothetical protein
MALKYVNEGNQVVAKKIVFEAAVKKAEAFDEKKVLVFQRRYTKGVTSCEDSYYCVNPDQVIVEQKAQIDEMEGKWTKILDDTRKVYNKSTEDLRKSFQEATLAERDLVCNRDVVYNKKISKLNKRLGYVYFVMGILIGVIILIVVL